MFGYKNDKFYKLSDLLIKATNSLKMCLFCSYLLIFLIIYLFSIKIELIILIDLLSDLEALNSD